MEYKRFTDEERQKAKNTDMIAFLGNYMGFEFKRSANIINADSMTA